MGNHIVQTELRIKLKAATNGPDVEFVFKQYDDDVVAGEIWIETGDVVTSVYWDEMGNALQTAEKLFSGG